MEHNINTGKMIAKLSKLLQFSNRPLEERERIAVELTSPELLRMRFSHLLDAGNKFMTEISNDEKRTFLDSTQQRDHHQQMKQKIATACNLPIRLSLQRIPEQKLPLAHTFTSLLKFEYGPFHAALIISDVTIEWGRAGIAQPRFEPRTEADFLALVGDDGEWKSREDNFIRQMSMANKNGSSIEKLEILHQSMSEKTQMIDRLVNVIAAYNRNKEFNVFTCNCQHFARDAMAALGIVKPVRFEGLLQQRFEQLKRGTVQVPRELKTHDNLDAYTTAFMDELDRSNMEYLQCLYFSFHLPAIEESEDRENWRCDIATCMSAELDRAITEFSIALKPSQLASQTTATPQVELQVEHTTTKPQVEVQVENGAFNQMIVPERMFGAALDSPERKIECSLATSANMEVVGTEMTDDLHAVKCLEMSFPQQTKLVGKFIGYREHVLYKYRSHLHYNSENEDEMIEVLTERERLFEQYFNAFVEKSEECILAISSDQTMLETHALSWMKLCQLSCQLIYRIDLKNHKIRKPACETPLTTSVVVNNITLEWNKAGLVVPVKTANESTDVATIDHILLVQDLSDTTEFSQQIENLKVQIETAVADKDVSAVILLMYEMTAQLEKCVYSLLDVIVRYNRYSNYNEKNCGHVHFAKAVLHGLGVTDQSLPTTSLQQYCLAPSLVIPQADRNITSHVDLDKYTFENCDSKALSEEREYLLSKYFIFHIENWKATNGKRDWSCSIETCQLLCLLSRHSGAS